MEFEKVIGVSMDSSESIANTGASYSEIAKTIASHMIKSRGTAAPVWRPYIAQEGVYYSGGCRDICFDAKKFYPDAKPGDAVYTACMIKLEKDYEVWINVIGACQVFLNGECLFSSWERAKESAEQKKYISLPVMLKSDTLHELVIKTVCTEEDFRYRLNISPPRCPSLWASFYLVNAMIFLPNKGLTKEEGIAVSPLYTGALSAEEAYNKRCEFEEKRSYMFPELKEESNSFDFYDIYRDGNIAFAYTVAEKDGPVTISADSPAKLLINRKNNAVLKSGESITIQLSKGDELLVKLLKTAKAWGFTAISDGNIGLPFLDSERAKDFSFTICGPFYQEGLESRLPPEYAENIMQPFPDGKGGQVFWRFQHAYLRAYLGSSFFGQWYYATMLSLLGIERCGETLDIPENLDYFISAMSFLADWYEYAVYDNKVFGMSQFMCQVASTGHLDNIGTMGVNFIEAYLRTGDKKYLPIIDILRRQIRKISRFEDCTFCRRMNGTMWADDFYMSNPFLARLYSQMDDNDSLEDIMCQLKGFCERLYMPDEKIFSHIYFLEKGVMNSIPWGRGNGWIALSLSEILLQIPEENPAHEAVRKVFSEFCEGIAALQDESGLWHQVLNRPESYLETSCTAMFSLAIFRGVYNGWLSESFLETAERGLSAILNRCVDKNGVVYGVCMGSSCSMDAKYYFDLTTVKDDNHGTGIVLMLLCEKIKMKKAENIEEG